MNANSSVKEEAWDFVKFLISENIQPGGFPLNKQAFQKQAQQLIQAGNMKVDEDGPNKGKSYQITETDIQTLTTYLTGAIHPVEYKPSKVGEIIGQESQAYFSGQKSAEDVAKLIQNRVTLYLNE
ncbi:hypothetical protein D3C73_1205490 [compost metagenome]